MLDYLISSANILGLVGCFYVAYVIAGSFSLRARNADYKSSHGYADHELLFRNPCVDYYI
ncbi:MAG: hypothetical protein ABI547_03300 [Betaproteobacteria bacterium]